MAGKISAITTRVSVRVEGAVGKAAGRVLGNKMMGWPKIQAALHNVLPLLPMLSFESAPFLIPMAGICNLRNVLCDSFANVVAGVKGRDQEIIRQFNHEIEEIKTQVLNFVDKLVEGLRSKMGMNSILYQLDDHEISHVFENWIKETEVAKLGGKEAEARLKAMLAKQIDLKSGDSSYLDYLGEEISSSGITATLARQIAELQKKTEKYLKDNPLQNGNGQSGDNSDGVQGGQAAGRKKSV